MKHICVFCSANDVRDQYKKPALEFARLMVAAGYDLVWGGSDTGLMKEVASTVQGLGGKIIGISVEFLRNEARKNADEMIIAKTLSERKDLFLYRADAIAVLVGGVGTLDEVTEMVERKKHNFHRKPIVFLNTNNFYKGLQLQLHTMGQEGLLGQPPDRLIHFSDTPGDAIDYITTMLSL